MSTNQFQSLHTISVVEMCFAVLSTRETPNNGNFCGRVHFDEDGRIWKHCYLEGKIKRLIPSNENYIYDLPVYIDLSHSIAIRVRYLFITKHCLVSRWYPVALHFR